MTATATTTEEVDIIKKNNKSKRWLLIINALILAIGNCGGPLIMRLYFLHGGNRIWLSSWLETGGWPINFIPLVISYLQRRRRDGPSVARPFFMNSTVFLASTIIGVLTGFDDYLYAYGMSLLPVSTASLIIASQLVFTAVFAFFLVKQQFTSFTINAVVLLTVAAVVLGLHTSGDRPEGETNKEYYIGFAMTVAAAVLYGLILPLVELTYKKAKQVVTYTLVLEIQLVMCFFATVVCTVGMVINNDFKVIPREAREFDLGEKTYYVVIVFSGLLWQCFYLGAIGVIFAGSSLLSAIIIAVLLPITEILSVIFFKEKFTVDKGISLVLSLWGFASYFYGEANHSSDKKDTKVEVQRGEAELATGIP